MDWNKIVSNVRDVLEKNMQNVKDKVDKELFNGTVDRPVQEKKNVTPVAPKEVKQNNGPAPALRNVQRELSDSQFKMFDEVTRPELPTFYEFLDVYSKEKDSKKRGALIDIYSKVTPLANIPVTRDYMRDLKSYEDAIQGGYYDYSTGQYDPSAQAKAARKEIERLMKRKTKQAIKV